MNANTEEVYIQIQLQTYRFELLAYSYDIFKHEITLMSNTLKRNKRERGTQEGEGEGEGEGERRRKGKETGREIEEEIEEEAEGRYM